MADSIVTMRAILVMYLSGDPQMPIPDQAPATIDRIEAQLTSLRGRRCYGVVVDGEYRACVTILADDDPAVLGLLAWNLPGGRYVRRKFTDFLSQVHVIPVVFEELMQRDDYDPSRPNLEYYRSHSELFLMVPVKQ